MTTTKQPKPIRHGTPGGYSNQSCRCPACRAAWAEYMRPRVAEWRARKQAGKAVAK